MLACVNISIYLLMPQPCHLVAVRCYVGSRRRINSTSAIFFDDALKCLKVKLVVTIVVSQSGQSNSYEAC